jgi:hypothetical protein
MATNIKDLLQNLDVVVQSPASIATVLDFERVLDEMDLYAYAHWIHGELVEGPVYEKYFVTCTFMWPYKKMPDPRGAKRLLQYGCEVEYKRDILEIPVKIETPYDFKAGTKFAKMTHYKIWLVTIIMPKDLMNNIEKGTIEIENESLDMEDIEAAYEEGSDESDDEQNMQNPQGGMEDQGGGAAGINPMPTQGNPELPTQGGF